VLVIKNVLSLNPIKCLASSLAHPKSNESRRLFLSSLLAGSGSLFLAACGGDEESPGASVAHVRGRGGQLEEATVKAASSGGIVVDATFFGMHTGSVTDGPWPKVSFQVLRTWDHWPGVSWADLNPSQAVFKWSNLDAVVDAAVSHGVDLVYTFGYTPSWVLSNPTDGGMKAWQTFVTEIVSRYQGRIRYWELWNEPNVEAFWGGTTAQLVTMASCAYGIIRNAGGAVLSPAPQGMNAHLWLDDYFAAGGGSFTDVVSFHGYVHGAPELIVSLVTDIRAVMARHGLSGAELWDTEHSWGDESWPLAATQDQRSAWLARFIVLSFASKIARSIWYMYDSKDWGTLADESSEQILATGVAYQQIYKWMLGATMSACTLSDNVYQCRLTRAGSYEGLIVWDVGAVNNQTAGFSVPSGFTQYQTLDGEIVSIAAGAQVPVGMKPILIEKC
jgi:hypothetical protein